MSTDAKRDRRLPTGRPPVCKCRYCKTRVAWLIATGGLPMPVNASTHDGVSRRFNPSVGHVSHYSTCAVAQEARVAKNLPSLKVRV